MQKSLSRRKKSVKYHIMIEMILCVIAETAAVFLMLSAAAKIYCKLDLNLNAIPILANAVIALSSFPSAFVFAWMHGKYGAVSGLLSGIIFFLVLCLAAVLAGRTYFTPVSLIKCISMMICGALGGFTGMICKEKCSRTHYYS